MRRGEAMAAMRRALNGKWADGKLFIYNDLDQRPARCMRPMSPLGKTWDAVQWDHSRARHCEEHVVATKRFRTIRSVLQSAKIASSLCSAHNKQGFTASSSSGSAETPPAHRTNSRTTAAPRRRSRVPANSPPRPRSTWAPICFAESRRSPRWCRSECSACRSQVFGRILGAWHATAEEQPEADAPSGQNSGSAHHAVAADAKRALFEHLPRMARRLDRLRHDSYQRTRLPHNQEGRCRRTPCTTAKSLGDRRHYFPSREISMPRPSTPRVSQEPQQFATAAADVEHARAGRHHVGGT